MSQLPLAQNDPHAKVAHLGKALGESLQILWVESICFVQINSHSLSRPVRLGAGPAPDHGAEVHNRLAGGQSQGWGSKSRLGLKTEGSAQGPPAASPFSPQWEKAYLLYCLK